MKHWYSLSDLEMNNALIEVPKTKSFQRIEIISYRISDKSMISAFLHLLDKYNLGERIFETVKARLMVWGMLMKQGTGIVATLIVAPSATEIKDSK